MTPFQKKHTILAGTLLGAAFFISLLSMVLFPQPLSRRVLFFPNGVTGELDGEEHYIPRRPEQEEAITLFVKELILGPKTLGSIRVLPLRTEIEMLLLRNGELLIDFSPEILDVERDLSISFGDVLEMTEYNIRYNFPRVKKITITVAGQLPRTPRYVPYTVGNNR